MRPRRTHGGEIVMFDRDPFAIADVVRQLATDGHAVEGQTDPVRAEEIACAARYDLLILAVDGQPDPGMHILRAMRRAGVQQPVLTLGNHPEPQAVAHALDAGADDFLRRPCAAIELRARVRALLRRQQGESAAWEIGEVRLDRARQSASSAQGGLGLTRKEYLLLQALVRRSHCMVPRSELLREAWGLHFDPGTRLLDVHMSHLRRKLEGCAVRIETVRGAGFVLTDRPAV